MDVVQANCSRSVKGVLRGLRFQKGTHRQAKLVRCIKGNILDVAVDIRRNSETFGEYIKEELSEENKRMLYIPRGFAHGFLVLSDVAEVAYECDNLCSKENESGLIWNDKTVNIGWPIKNPLLSDKDKKWPTLSELD